VNIRLYIYFIGIGTWNLFDNKVIKFLCARRSNSSAAAADCRGCWHASIALCDVAVWQFYLSECCLVNRAFRPELCYGDSSGEGSTGIYTY